MAKEEAAGSPNSDVPLTLLPASSDPGQKQLPHTVVLVARAEGIALLKLASTGAQQRGLRLQQRWEALKSVPITL